MILLSCSDHGIAIFAKILRTIFDMVLIIGPPLLMVSLGFLFLKIMTSADLDEKGIYKKRIKNSVLSLVIVVFLPIFVNLVMQSTFMNDTFEVATCFNEAKSVVFSTKNTDYIKDKDVNKNKTDSYIIDPNKYKGTDGDPNADLRNQYGNNDSEPTEISNGNVDLSTRQGQIQGAINWAVNIANDNSFAYGPKPYASRGGCYFCGTNGGKAKAARGHSDATPPKGKSWDKTYVCMTFVNAAYAHGAKDPIFLKYCKKGGSALDGNARKAPTLKALGNRVKDVGKPAYEDLEPGDIMFITGVHVAMYIGKGKYVEASGYGWADKSIAVKKLSKRTYSSYSFVLRYQGH